MRFAAVAAVAFAAVLAGCSSRPDPSKERAMGLDGSLFVWEPGVPVAFVSGYEYEGNYQANGIMVIFPINRRTVRPVPGLEISLKPDLETGSEIGFGGRERGGGGSHTAFRRPAPCQRASWSATNLRFRTPRGAWRSRSATPVPAAG